jgi:hypothetical protein
MNTLLYLTGEPGVGKSTLMSELTARWRRVPLEPSVDAPARDALVPVTSPPPESYREPQRWEAVEIGHRWPLSGTDALPPSVISVAELYLVSGRAARETELLLAEGARLANRRFLSAARESDWRVILVHLVGEGAAAERRAARAAALGVPEQDRAWVKGRRTAAANLADDAHRWGYTVIGLDAAYPPAHLRRVLEPVIGALV